MSSFCRGRLQAMDEGEKQETGEGKFEQGQGAVFGWLNALLGSWWFLPWLYHGWAAFQWKLKEWVRRVGVPSISLVSAWQRAGKAGTPKNWPMLAEITPLNFRFISMGLVVHGLSCFSVPTQRSFWHPASFPFSPLIYLLQTSLFTPCSYFFFLTLPLQFLQDPGLVIPLPHRQPSVFLSPHSLLSHPVLHFPALWMGHSAVTEWDTLLWVPLVNVSITSSLRQRGENP